MLGNFTVKWNHLSVIFEIKSKKTPNMILGYKITGTDRRPAYNLLYSDILLFDNTWTKRLKECNVKKHMSNN